MLLARAGHALAEPFRGVTTGGGVVPGLFSPGRTGASPAPLVAAAGAFLGALLGVARVSARNRPRSSARCAFRRKSGAEPGTARPPGQTHRGSVDGFPEEPVRSTYPAMITTCGLEPRFGTRATMGPRTSRVSSS